MAIMTQWNGTEWVTLSDYVAPDDSVTQPLVMEDSAPVCRRERHFQPVRRKLIRYPGGGAGRRPPGLRIYGKMKTGARAIKVGGAR